MPNGRLAPIDPNKSWPAAAPVAAAADELDADAIIVVLAPPLVPEGAFATANTPP